MNKTEEAFFDEYIKPRLDSGEYHRYRFEEITFKLADSEDKKQKTTYTPDFYVVDKDGHVSIFETKGSFYHEDARVKYKVAASEFAEFDWYWVEIKGKKIVSMQKWK